jgi:D-beta-D-heptose 7-phosphate kinase/D-beta-D-heptose 1-phosphate adenosyltransferase
MKEEQANIIVLGDFMLDTYVYGEIDRISPEAPVPVFKIKDNKTFPGGAGNVAMNLGALGAKVVAAGVIGNDREGLRLRDLLATKFVNAYSALVMVDERITTHKKRFIAQQNQQVFRVDDEDTTFIPLLAEQEIYAYLCCLLPQCHALVISDYNKGVVIRSLVTCLISKAREYSIPIIVDPKGSNWQKYRHATILTPNSKELYTYVGPTTKSLAHIANDVIHELGIEYLLVTQGEKGMSLFTSSGEETRLQADIKQVYDLTGAGDTVVGILAFCLANRMKLLPSLMCANYAAGLVVGKPGISFVTLEEMRDGEVGKYFNMK